MRILKSTHLLLSQERLNVKADFTAGRTLSTHRLLILIIRKPYTACN